MTTETEDKLASARSQAMAQYDSIVEMVDRLRVANDDEAYEAMAKELAEASGFTVLPNDEDGYCWAKGDGSQADDTSYDDEDEAWLACCDDNGLRPDADEARQAIEEDALSCEVRSGWTTPGNPMEAEEFRILLCTGGPAVQIRGELGQYSEPSRAWMECQDWFTSWTEVFGEGERRISQDTLLEYARCFFFGE